MALRSIERFETVEAFWQALTARVPEQQELPSGTTPIDLPRLVAEQDAVGRPTTPMRKQRPVPLVFQRGALPPILASLLAIIALDVAFLSQGWNLAAFLLLVLGALLLLLLLWLTRQ
jgi:hypothetical protein